MAQTNAFTISKAVAKTFTSLTVDEVIACVFGGIVLLTVFELMRINLLGHKLPASKRRVWVTRAIISLFLGFIFLFLWETVEYVAAKADRATAQIQTLNSSLTTARTSEMPPTFQAELTDNPDINESNWPGGEKKAVAVFSTYVLNNGAPSIAWKWKCKAKLVSGLMVNSEASQMKLTLMGSPTNAIYSDSERYLQFALLEKPLGNGSGMNGWVAFVFPMDIHGELRRPGVEFTIQFEDRNKQATTLQWSVPVDYGRKK
jgi:hypothetical protein